MILRTLRLGFAVVLFSCLVSACGGRGSSAPPPAGGITVVPGDGQVTVTWTPDPGVDYWLFYAPTSSISTTTLSSTPGHRGVINVTSPYVLTGLTNGVTYSFTMDGRISGGPGGPGTPSVSAIPRPAGTTWLAGGTMGATDMHGIAYGTASNAIAYYLSVGNGGAMYQSTDGVSWTVIPGGIAANLNAALYALGKFMTVGAAGNIFYSSDTLTWTASTSGTTQNLNAVATNGAFAVAVGDSGTIQYSTDGVTWYPAVSVPTGNNLYGISYSSSGLWVAVGAGGTLVTSSDGTNWSLGTSGTAVDLKSVAFRAATTTYPASYAAVGLGGLVLTSSDGISWTSQTLSPASNLLAIVPTASQFLAVGTGGAAFTSPDGIAWTSQTTGSSSTFFGLVNAQAQYVAVGLGGTSIYSR